MSGSSFEASKKIFLSGTDLKSEVIESWKQLEKELLNPFYSIRYVVSMMKLTNTKQHKGEPVIDYINRWRTLGLDCKDKL